MTADTVLDPKGGLLSELRQLQDRSLGVCGTGRMTTVLQKSLIKGSEMETESVVSASGKPSARECLEKAEGRTRSGVCLTGAAGRESQEKRGKKQWLKEPLWPMLWKRESARASVQDKIRDYCKAFRGFRN